MREADERRGTNVGLVRELLPTGRGRKPCQPQRPRRAKRYGGDHRQQVG